jgi:plastocyanin
VKKLFYLTALAVLVITGALLTISCGTNSTPVTSTAAQGAQTKPPPGQTAGPDFNPAAVTIENFAFSPASVTVSVGTTVTWTNKDSATHTVTSLQGNVLNSGNIATGGTFSFTFNQTGTFDYHCAIHPSMTGKVIVQ